MKFNYYIPLLILAAASSSCEKTPLPDLPESNEPYYQIRGLVNGDSINWVAGLDNVTYNFGTIESNGIDMYWGQINSGVNDMAVRVQVVEPEIIYYGSSISSINSGQINYLVHEPACVKFNFGLNYSQTNYLLVKNENNDFVQQNEITLNEFGIHNLSLKFTDYSSTESFVLPVRHGFEYSQLNPLFESESNGDTLHVLPETVAGYHEWYLNGELISTANQLWYELADGIYQLRHKLKDYDGNISEHTTLIRMKEGVLNWQLNYYYLAPSEASSHYGNVIISMRKNGVWYSSAHTDSNLDKSFVASDIRTKIDQNYQPISTLFDFEFGALLYNESKTDSLYLPQMIGSLSVGLK